MKAKSEARRTVATNPEKTVTFEMNGKGYRTDAETLEVLRSIVPDAVRTGDHSAVAVAMGLGLMMGRIEEMA